MADAITILKIVAEVHPKISHNSPEPRVSALLKLFGVKKGLKMWGRGFGGLSHLTWLSRQHD